MLRSVNACTLVALTSVALVVGCSGKDDDDFQLTYTETDEPPQPATTTHTGFQPAEDRVVSDAEATLFIAQIRSHAYGGSSMSAGGLFTEDLGGYINVASCLILFTAPCTRALPADGETLVADPYGVYGIFRNDFYDGGALTLGDTRFPPQSNPYGGIVYYEGQPIRYGGAADIEFGEPDLVPFSGQGLFDFADPINVDQDVSNPILVESSDKVTLSWDAGDGEVYVIAGDTIINPTGRSHELDPVADLGLEPPLDFGQVNVSRHILTTVQADDHTLFVETMSTQYVFFEYVNADGWIELDETTIADTCAGAQALTPVGAGSYLGDTRLFEDDIELGDRNDATGARTPGPDGVIPIALGRGDQLTVTYNQVIEDATFYLLPSNCDPDAAEHGADLEGSGDPETFSYEAERDEVVYLVVDTFDAAGGRFWLEIEIEESTEVFTETADTSVPTSDTSLTTLSDTGLLSTSDTSQSATDTHATTTDTHRTTDTSDTDAP